LSPIYRKKPKAESPQRGELEREDKRARKKARRG